jgi:heme ABC exporter ATP-binding subunit CcmA
VARSRSFATSPSPSPRANGSRCAARTEAGRPRSCAASRASRNPIPAKSSGKARPSARNRSAFHEALSYGGHLAGIKDDLTADENLAALVALRGRPVDAQSRRAALSRMGLEKRLHLPARRLSAGQRRRIGLARLAVEGAPLWALDEPLTALDDEGQRLFEHLLAEHLASGGIAVIATHHALAPEPARELRLGS